MTKIAGAIIVVLGIVALILFSSGRIDITSKEGWIDWDRSGPPPTLDAGDAAANATMVAQQQLAEIEASAAQVRAQATAQAAAAWATEQAMIADQACLDQAAAKQTEGTAQAAQATVTHEEFVVAATSAAEAVKTHATAVAATATRQVEENQMTATVESRHATVTRQAIERIEKEKDQKHARQVRTKGGVTALLYVAAMILAGVVLLLLRPCLKYMEQCIGRLPSTWRAMIFIYKKHIGGK